MGGLIENVHGGKISMKEVDQAVSRLLRLKFQVGLFDNPCVDPECAAVIVNSKEQRDLGLESSRGGVITEN